ncbi:MAG: ExbD/TolR family protein [Phycisphaerales bacterium JB059]
MRSVRRSSPDVRLEMTPLLDVVFLLLTFFVFSLVLMVRADVLDVKLPELGAGRAAERAPAITIVIDEEGSLFVEGEPAVLAEIGDRVRALRTERGESAPVLLAVDAQGRSGDLIELADTLNAEGIGEFSVIGRPAPGGETTPDPAAPGPANGGGFVPTGPVEE